ncbi:MAG: DUF1003 domain-containing protein [Nanoarchaeota archaeon]|mgnify:FL=1
MEKRSNHPLIGYKRTFGQKSADLLTNWVGSWTFLILILLIIIIWIFTNGYFLLKYFNKSIIDPYPFILLNLVMSLLTAIQAPIIMMSQKRQAHRDRIRAEYDYSINKKAEREIEFLMKEVMEIKGIVKKR